MKTKTLILAGIKAWFIPCVSTRLSTEGRKVDLIWSDKDKTQVEFVNNENGRYVIGCDPAFMPNLWQKLWMKFGFYKKYRSHSAIMTINADGTAWFIK